VAQAVREGRIGKQKQQASAIEPRVWPSRSRDGGFSWNCSKQKGPPDKSSENVDERSLPLHDTKPEPPQEHQFIFFILT